MADGRDETPYPARKGLFGGHIFRCFQVALDPRKLVVAAAGILAMSLGWYVLSAVFYYDPPKPEAEAYTNAAVEKANEGKGWTEDQLRAEGKRWFQRDYDQWVLVADLAAPAVDANGRTIPGGRLRTMPWAEYRGENPYLLLSGIVGGNSAERSVHFSRFLSATVPVLVEPLAKLFLPLIKFIDPNASPWARVYLLLCLTWSLAVWALAGGIITRIAAVQLTGNDRVTLADAVKFVTTRYVSYALSPLVPLGIIAVIAVGLLLYGLVALIPWVGDFLLYGLGMPLVLLGGLVMAVLLIGLVGYPMMYATISTEGSDTFDALSRSYNYVFQAPWTYLWYSVVAIAYGAILTLVVVFVGSLAVYMAKWSVGQAPFSERTDRKADYLFVYAPTSFGWQELFLRGSKLEEREVIEKSPAGNPRASYEYTNPEVAKQYLASYAWYEKAGAGLVSVWLTAVFLLMLGFSYSYFWSVSTAIYLLMREKVDQTELSELYVEEDLPEVPLTPPAAPTPAPAADAGKGLSLPTVTVPPPPPATIPLGVPPAPPVSPPPLPLAADKPAETAGSGTNAVVVETKTVSVESTPIPIDAKETVIEPKTTPKPNGDEAK